MDFFFKRKFRIRNSGSIKEGYKENDGWIEFKKETVFIGNQGSGKSTVAKAISTLTWLEKSINRGDVDKMKISFATFMKYFEYQKIRNYFSENTFIEYIEEKYHILYDKKGIIKMLGDYEGIPSDKNCFKLFACGVF